MCRSFSIDGSATFTTVLSSMIMKRPKATAASVHHFLFSSAKMPCSHSNSRLASTKLVGAKLAERIRVPQGVRLHLEALGGARRARERDAAAAPPRSRELRRAARDLGRGARPLLARPRRRPRDRVLAALDVGRRLLARAGVVDVVQRRPRQRRAREPAPLGGDAARRRGLRRPLRGRRPRIALLRGGLAADRRSSPRRSSSSASARETGSRSTCRCRRRSPSRRTRARTSAPSTSRSSPASPRPRSRRASRTRRPRSRSAPTGRSAAASGSRCARRSTKRGRTRSSTWSSGTARRARGRSS